MTPIQGGGGGGGGGGALTLIGSDVLAAPATSLSVSSIPAIYSHLLIVASLRSTVAAASDNAYIQFNGDTANTYYYSEVSRLYGALTYGPFQNSASVPGLASIAAGSTAAAALFSSIEMWVADYAVAKVKAANYRYNVVAGAFSTAGNINTYSASGWWNQTAAITEVAVALGTGPDFATLSGLYVYGVT